MACDGLNASPTRANKFDHQAWRGVGWPVCLGHGVHSMAAIVEMDVLHESCLHMLDHSAHYGNSVSFVSWPGCAGTIEFSGRIQAFYIVLTFQNYRCVAKSNLVTLPSHSELLLNAPMNTSSPCTM